jgi:glycosyltransferase involved in cell wall biosynthesis
MRILVLTPTFLPALGGAEILILQIYHRLALRHDVFLITPFLSTGLLNATGSEDYNRLINFKVQRYVDRITLMKIRGHKFTRGLIPPFSLSAIAALRQAFKDFKPDVINVYYAMPTGLAGLCAHRLFNIPSILTYIGRDVPGPGIPPLWKWWHRVIGRNCADTIFISEYCRAAIFGQAYREGHIIYSGVEPPAAVSPQQVSDLRTVYGIEHDQLILFSLQRLDYLKRVDVLIQSMPEILIHHPNTHLIIGGKGPDRARLENMARELKLSSNIHFTGFISDEKLPVYFAAADLFLFHSTYETFGMVLAEAMNYGKAIVTVTNTAIPEVVDADKTGLLVGTLDIHGFSKAVVRLLNDPPRRKQMGKNGREKAQRIFGWDTIAARYEKVFESVISPKSRSLTPITKIE